MSTHVTDRELRDFTKGQLSPDDLLRVDAHLTACDACRRRAMSGAGAAEALDDLVEHFGTPSTSDHLSDDHLQAFVAGRLPRGDAEQARHHLEHCRTCAAQVDDLRQWAATRSPIVRWLPLAAVIALAVLIPAAIWIASSRRNAPALDGMDALSAVDQARVRGAIESGAAALPGFLTARGGSEVRMGVPGAAAAFRVLAPYNTSTVTDRPAFEWERAAGADTYKITIFDEKSNPLVSSPPVTGTTWTPPEPLPRGHTYIWQVTANLQGSTVIAPAAPAPPALFHVLDAATASLLERMERDRPQAHLVLGILEMEAGVRDRAASHFRQVPPGSPHADVAARSLERLVAAAPNPQGR